MPGDEHFAAPADKPLLDAAHAANILIAYSCRSGQCRSCLVRVVSGDIAYPRGWPPAISAGEADSGLALCCSAMPRSDLVIEILAPEF